MLLLPKNLGTLAGLAAHHSLPHAPAPMRGLEARDGCYRCEVTDGKALAIVCGPSKAAAIEEAQIRQRLESVEGSAREALVPAAAWRDGFKLIGKGTALGLALGDREVTMATAKGMT